MRTAIIVSVTEERQLELPPEIQEQLNPGDEYLIWQTDDTIMFKKIQKPTPYSDLWEKIQVEPDPDEMSMEEICEVVRDVRREMAKERADQE